MNTRDDLLCLHSIMENSINSIVIGCHGKLMELYYQIYMGTHWLKTKSLSPILNYGDASQSHSKTMLLCLLTIGLCRPLQRSLHTREYLQLLFGTFAAALERFGLRINSEYTNVFFVQPLSSPWSYLGAPPNVLFFQPLSSPWSYLGAPPTVLFFQPLASHWSYLGAPHTVLFFQPLPSPWSYLGAPPNVFFFNPLSSPWSYLDAPPTVLFFLPLSSH